MADLKIDTELLKQRQGENPQSVHGVNTLRGGDTRLPILNPLKTQKYKEESKYFRGVQGLKKVYQQSTKTDRMMNTEEMSLLEKTLDYLSRGNYMAAEATLGILEGDKFENLWDRAYAGVTGEKKTSFIDVMDELMGAKHPLINVGVGFAGDVILDPINLVPMSWPKKVGELLQLPKLIKAADEVTHVGKLIKRTKMVIGDMPGINWMGRAFKPGFALRKQPGAYKMYRDLELKIASIKRFVREELEQRWDMFRDAAQKLGVDPDWASAEMIRAHEAGEFANVEELDEAFRKVFRVGNVMGDPEAMDVLKRSYTDIVAGFEKMAKDEAAAGILKTKNIKENYFPHIYEKGELKVTPEGKWKAKGRYGFFTSLRYRAGQFFTKPREFKTLEDAKLYLAKEAIGGAPIPVPVEHWFRGYAVRRFVGESALAWKGFIDDSVAEFGRPIDKMLEESAKEAGYNSLQEAMKAKATGFDEIWGRFQAKIPKGYRLVLPTTSLKSPAASSLAEKMLKEGLAQNESELAMLFEKQGPNFLYKLFSKVKGSGLTVDVSDDLVKTLKGQGVYLMPTEVADNIKNSFKMFSTDEEVKGFLGAMDGAMHLWKSMATSLRLPFHHRNAISNTWLMYLGGVRGPQIPQRLAQAARIQLRDKGFKFQGFNAEELLEIADRYGVRAYGWIAADVPRMFQKELFISTERSAKARKLGVGVNPYNPGETAMRLGRKYGTFIEDNARLGLFLDYMKKNGIKKGAEKDTLYEAANHVKKYLFDYTELTPFERNVMKRGMPFYTWMRKNIPLQLESIVTHPEKFARLADVERDLFPLFTEEETPAQKKVRPGWLDEMRARKLKDWQTEDGTPIYTWIDLPVMDLHKMQKLGKYLSSSVNPLLVMFNIAQNVKTWPESGKIAEPGQKTVAPFYVQFLPQKDWGVMGIEPIRNKKTGKVVLGIDPQWKYALNTALPFLNDWEQMHPGGVELGIMREGETLPRAISYMTGIKFKPMNQQDLALQKYYRMLDARKNLRRAGKQQIELTPQEQRLIFRQTLE